VDERALRVGRNEALFREVNEQVESLTRTFAVAVEDALEIVCECAELSCVERIAVTLATYERVRSDAHLFLVKPGHEEGDVEEVVERAPGYNIVRKSAGDARRVVEETDPRAE
jgi:hypothetical protein